MFPYRHAEMLAGILPDVTLVPIEDSYTYIPEDQPLVLAGHIDRFLAERLGGELAVHGSSTGLAVIASSSGLALHPSLPPGPRLPRSLQAVLWTWWYADYSRRGHARYGDTFTVRAGTLKAGVLTSDRDPIRRLFTGDPLTKRHGNDLLRLFLGEHSVLLLEPPEHLTRRKMLLPPFHGERVRSYARLMEQLVAPELDRVKVGETIAVQPIAQALTLDVILQAVLGVSGVAMRQRLRRIFDSLITPLSNLVPYLPQLARRSRWNLLSPPYWRLKDEARWAPVRAHRRHESRSAPGRTR